MKKLSKVLVLVLAAVMTFAMASITTFAAETGTITIKVPQTQQPTTVATTYKIYKVFDAAGNGTAISYKLVDGKTTAPTGFTVDAAGNVSLTRTSGDLTKLTADEIAAIAGYVEEADLVATVTAPAGATSVTSEALPNGFYYITTTTGTAVTIDSTNPDVTVEDKNVIPKVVKSAGTQYDAASLKAIAAVGTDQPFTAQITKTHGATNLVFEDTMTNMTYNADVKVTIGGAEVQPSETVNTDADDETFKVSGAQGDSSFTVTFDNDYIAGLTDGTEITLNYSGKITSDALSANPATNKATLTSGNGNTSTSEEVKVYNAKFTVTKQDGDGEPLADAGFVIKNASGAYYKLNAATATAPASITWYTLAEGETLAQAIAADKVTEYTSDATGAVPAFTGLADGSYTLVESTTPDGYNTAEDYNFTISGTDYTTANLEQSTTVTNNAGAVLPTTGGIGTTIFYVLGSLLVIGCGIVLVSRKRMQNNK